MNRLSRRHVLQAAGAAAAVGLGRGLWAQTKPEKRQITVAVEGRASLLQLPLVLAEQLGYFRAEGLNVLLADVSGAPWQALGHGADLVAGAYEHTLQQQARGQWLQAVMLQTRTPQAVLGVSPKAMPQFRQVTDLRGRRVGVTALGSVSHRLVQQVLVRGGLPAQAAEFVEVGAGWTALNAYRSGQIDALCHIDPVMSTLEQYGEIRVVSDTRSFNETVALFGGPLPASCLYAPEAFVAAHPQTCEAVVHAMVHALKWLQTAGPSDIIKTVPERLLEDRALYLAAFGKARSAYTTDGLMPAAGPATLWQHLARFDEALKGATPDLARSFNNTMALRAKARFKA